MKRSLIAVVALITALSLASADDGCVQQGTQQQCRASSSKQVVRPGET